jgi:heme exporter protein D
VSYQNYVVAAYAVFVIVLGWDFIATRLQVSRQLRAARRRSARGQARAATQPPRETR